MAVRIAQASISENGTVHGKKAGNQTGKELNIRSWYNKNWNCVIRLKEDSMRSRLAIAMVSAVSNPNIGYSQDKRNSLLTYARKVKYDPSKVFTPCDTDCSALVSVACMYAGIPESVLYKGGNCSTTSNLKSRLKPYSTIITSKEYTTHPKNLVVGDILLYEGHHVAVVVESENQSINNVTEIAQEVLDGKWGVGTARKKKLTEAGYDYNAVQSEVNRLLKGKL